MHVHVESKIMSSFVGKPKLHWHFVVGIDTIIDIEMTLTVTVTLTLIMTMTWDWHDIDGDNDIDGENDSDVILTVTVTMTLIMTMTVTATFPMPLILTLTMIMTWHWPWNCPWQCPELCSFITPLLVGSVWTNCGYLQARHVAETNDEIQQWNEEDWPRSFCLRGTGAYSAQPKGRCKSRRRGYEVT